MRRVGGYLHDGDTSTMTRLKDGYVNFGIARHEHYVDSYQILEVYKMVTGTVSCYMLFNILERMSEHFWVCNDYNLSTND
jgi:hypothetical protein